MNDTDRFEVVFESHDEVEAEIAVDLLEKNGLTARMLGSRNAALLGAANFAFLLKVEVPADEVEKAQELLDAFMQEQESPPEIAEEEWRAGAAEAAAPAEVAPAASAAAAAGTEKPGKEDEPEPAPAPPTSSRSPVVAPIVGLLGMLVTLFVLGGSTVQGVEDLGGVRGVPAAGELYRLVTSSFLHFDARHLLSNFEGLIVYGWAAIALFGLERAAFAYTATALAGGLACALLVGEQALAAGSSGCVFALTAMVLAGKLRQARAEKTARWRGWMRVLGWSAFVLPSALFFSYVVHFAGLLTGAVLGSTLAMAPASEEQPPLARRGRWLAGLAAALLVLPWGQRIAASFYAPCRTGNLERCAVACDRGDLGACHALGARRMADERTFPNDQILSPLRRSCEGGLAEACVDYGVMLDLLAMPVESLAALGKACDASSARGCAELGARERNPELALQYLERGCKGGDAAGCLRLGLVLKKRGRPGDEESAATALRAACAAGKRRACDILSGARAAQPELTLACLDGDEDACRAVASDVDRREPRLRRPVARPVPGPFLPTPFHFL
ncbi:MAG TPA: rhomboid family intramembrane serine protease [Myxococcales bacterium]